MVYQLAYILDKTSFARVVKLVDTRDLKSLASNSVPVQVRLRVPLHSPILSYRTAKAPDIRGFVVSGVLYYSALSIPSLCIRCALLCTLNDPCYQSRRHKLGRF